MDNQDDSNIIFDKNGYCNYCNHYYNIIAPNKTSLNLKESNNYILKLIDEIKKENSGKAYDCLVGISGGTDSAYLIHKLIELGLKPLAVHYDNGWNSETATQNIELLLKKLNVDLFTYVNDWEEFKDLQISFLKAGVIDIELLTDQAIIALLYNMSVKFNTKYIFTGHNTATESILPQHWYHWKLDVLNIKSIHKKFGTKKIKTYPTITFWQQYYHLKFRKTKMISLLNYIDYNKNEAQKILSEKYDWKNYGYKHNESIFTRFYQNYILPVKFGVDKRKAHLSSLICSGQITREEALEEMKKKIWETEETLKDKEYVLKKLDISVEKFDKWMKSPPVSHFEFKSYLTREELIIKSIKKIFKIKI
jgi:N-acetyl sugar amidotransferase